MTILCLRSDLKIQLKVAKIEDEEPNFYNNEYRIGQWITPDNRDTLDFIDNVRIIRKGDSPLTTPAHLPGLKKMPPPP